MKWRSLGWAVPVTALALSSCGKKETPPAQTQETPATAPAAPVAPTAPVTPAAPVVPAAPAEATVPKVPELSAEQRAAKFGAVKLLPQDTESVVAVYQAEQLVKQFKGSQFWKTLGLDDETEVKPSPVEEGEQEDAEEMAEGAASQPQWQDFIGQEFFIATAKGSSEQFENALKLNESYRYATVRVMAHMLATKFKDGELDSNAFEPKNAELFTALLNDPESGINTIEKLALPPVYIGFKPTAAKKAEIAKQLAGGIDMLGMMQQEYLTPVSLDVPNGKMTGYKVLGAKLSEQLAGDRAEMDEALGKEKSDRLLATLAKRNFVLMQGVVGDYIVLFLGNDEKECRIAANPAESLAASKELGFVDGFADKSVTALVYNNKAMSEVGKRHSGGVATMARGIRDGISGVKELGDTRDLEALLQLVGENEKALLKLGGSESAGVVAFLEQGLKIESFGGADSGMLDWKAPNRLAKLGDGSDAILFANWSNDLAFDEKAQAYFSSMIEASYAGAVKASQLDIKDPEFAQFKEGLGLFDTKFRTDALTLWDAIKTDLGAGLGQEAAFVVDVKGSMPALPGVPKKLVEEGKFVRASYIAPVVDRSKVQAAWTKADGAAKAITKTISEMVGKEIPMQKPMSSEKDGLSTWFFAIPFQSDDFVPSVTLNDRWFVASTSKLQAVDLAKKADGLQAGYAGATFKLDVDALRKYAAESFKLVDANADAIFAGKPSALEEFRSNRDDILKGITASEEVSALTGNVRRENGVIRGSMHFKTR